MFVNCFGTVVHVFAVETELGHLEKLWKLFGTLWTWFLGALDLNWFVVLWTYVELPLFSFFVLCAWYLYLVFPGSLESLGTVVFHVSWNWNP